jgi:hypothetical protein
MKKAFAFSLIIFLLEILPANAEDFLWAITSGNWLISNESHLLYDIEKKANSSKYSEPNNNSTISTMYSIKGITSIQSEIELYNPSGTNSAIVFLSPVSFRTLIGIRFLGEKNISKIELIRSEVIDTTLAPYILNNYTLTVIKDAAIAIDYGKKIPIELKIDKRKVEVLIDNRKIFDYESDRDLSNGYLGYGHKNNLIKVYSSRILSGKTVVFEDTFVKDRIKRYTVQAKKVQ